VKKVEGPQLQGQPGLHNETLLGYKIILPWTNFQPLLLTLNNLMIPHLGIFYKRNRNKAQKDFYNIQV
jgi:hypothetical protein